MTPIFLLLCSVAARIPSLLDIEDARDRELHTYLPAYIKANANFVIKTSSDWQTLMQSEPNRKIGFLQTFCALPDADTLSHIIQPFALFGPFAEWHLLNFGTFTNVGLPSLSSVREARLPIRLAHCNRTLSDLTDLLDNSYLRKWYAWQQIGISHRKIVPIPIGFGMHRVRAPSGDSVDAYKKLMLETLTRHEHTPRSTLLLVSYALHTELYANSGIEDPRRVAFRKIKSNPSLAVETRRIFTTDEEWLDALATSQFIASPPGWGPDCHRHYEAIAMGCVPIIVSDESLMRMLDGMPVLFINNWDELAQGGADFLRAVHSHMETRSYSLDKLFEDYWWREIFQ